MGVIWKSRPKVWGPGTDGPVWSEAAGRWVFPLNARGTLVVERFMAKYRGWPAQCVIGIKRLRWTRLSGRDVYRRAVREVGEDEVHALACEAVVRSAAHYKPEDHGCSEGAYTYIVFAVAQRLFKVLHESAGEVVELQTSYESWDEGDELDALDTVAGFEDDPADTAEVVEVRRFLDDMGRFLDPRERQAVVARYRYGWTLSEIGDRMGVSRERVRQLELRGLEKLRLAIVRHGLNRNTPGDGTTLPPPRSVRCLPTKRTNATTR